MAAVTYTFAFEGKTPDKKPFKNHGVYKAVLVEHDGKLVILQDHQSTPPPKR